MGSEELEGGVNSDIRLILNAAATFLTLGSLWCSAPKRAPVWAPTNDMKFPSWPSNVMVSITNESLFLLIDSELEGRWQTVLSLDNREAIQFTNDCIMTLFHFSDAEWAVLTNAYRDQMTTVNFHFMR